PALSRRHDHSMRGASRIFPHPSTLHRVVENVVHSVAVVLSVVDALHITPLTPNCPREYPTNSVRSELFHPSKHRHGVARPGPDHGIHADRPGASARAQSTTHAPSLAIAAGACEPNYRARDPSASGFQQHSCGARGSIPTRVFVGALRPGVRRSSAPPAPPPA